MKLSMTRLGLIGIAAFASAQAANAQTVALVTINQQALFFNQINDSNKKGIATEWATSRRPCSTRAGSIPRRREMARRKST